MMNIPYKVGQVSIKLMTFNAYLQYNSFSYRCLGTILLSGICLRSSCREHEDAAP